MYWSLCVMHVKCDLIVKCNCLYKYYLSLQHFFIYLSINFFSVYLWARDIEE